MFLASSKHVLGYVFGYHCLQVEGTWMTTMDELLDLVFMTKYSQSTFMWTVINSVFALIQYCSGWSSNTISEFIGLILVRSSMSFTM